MKKPKIWAGLLLLSAALLVLGWFWRQGVVAKRTAIASNAIIQGVADKDFVAARSAASTLADPALRSTREREIQVAELQQALAIRDTGLMRFAVGEDGDTWLDPKLLEAADLELAREAMQTGDFKSSEERIAKWKTKATLPGQWILLKADQWLARKQPDEARAFLQAAQLSGPEDALRHARLALLDAKEPWKAMESIDRGLRVDPRNADLLAFRAQIQEAAGRTADARLDYVAAVLSERKNPLYREILANFYLRTGDLAAAAETWRDAAEDTGLGVYALKSWFWSRVSGVALSKPLPPSRQKGWSELVTALAATPDSEFWNASLDGAVAGGNKRPEIAWLRLLEALRGSDPAAATLLAGSLTPEAERLQPGLALLLQVHLHAATGNPRLSLAGHDVPKAAADAHPFLKEFADWANRVTSDPETLRFETWLAGRPARVAILFASGWPGAAVRVGGGDKLPHDPDAPAWFDYGYARSLQIQGGAAPAKAWLESLPTRTAPAELMLGELQLTTGSVDAGIARLRQVADGGSPQASRAAWTLALTELDRGDSAAARQITLGHPELAGSVPGKEILARIALAEGTRDETLRIYRELGEQSADAMIFLSKEAFAAKNYAEARKWTGALARRFPEEPDFRRNLIQIDEAEKLTPP